MGADGYRRVSKHAGAENKNIIHTITPKSQISVTAKTQKQTTTKCDSPILLKKKLDTEKKRREKSVVPVDHLQTKCR